MHDCCRNLLKCLGEYLDAELDPALCLELEAHLGDCARCRAVVDSTRRTIQICCDERPVDLPEDVQQRLLDRLKKA